MILLWKKLRPLVRGAYRIFGGLRGFIYDFQRYLRFGGWREDLNDKSLRNYKLAMAYHGLEKSLSFKNRKPNSGWSNAERVYRKLKVANNIMNIGFHDRAGKEVLLQFLNLPANKKTKRADEMINDINKFNFKDDFQNHGSISFNSDDYCKGVLKNPENFFLSRYSLREFQQKNVSPKEIERAIKMAMKTPSVCNRQSWHIYHSSKPEIIKKVLKYQNGNRGFGDQIPELFIIGVDLRAFFVGQEHYQHWIDGGLFSMSLIYTLHSLGIASCALNWSQTPDSDKQLRKVINIDKHHTIIMMLAAGYPNTENKVCSSKRKPIEEIFSQIELK